MFRASTCIWMFLFLQPANTTGTYNFCPLLRKIQVTKQTIQLAMLDQMCFFITLENAARIRVCVWSLLKLFFMECKLLPVGEWLRNSQVIRVWHQLRCRWDSCLLHFISALLRKSLDFYETEITVLKVATWLTIYHCNGQRHNILLLCHPIYQTYMSRNAAHTWPIYLYLPHNNQNIYSTLASLCLLPTFAAF